MPGTLRVWTLCVNTKNRPLYGLATPEGVAAQSIGVYGGGVGGRRVKEIKVTSISTCSDIQSLHLYPEMPQRRKWCSLVACAIAAIAMIALLARKQPPDYQGRPLRYWLDRYNDDDPRTSGGDTALAILNDRNARDALRSCGPAALPWLVTWLGREPAAWEGPLRRVASRCLPPRGLRWFESREERIAAEVAAGRSGLLILGETASPAIPALERLATEPCRDRRVPYAVAALSGIGPRSLPSLMRLATNPAAHGRYAAISHLGDFGSNSLPALPLLLADFKTPDALLAVSASEALGHLALVPEVAVPALSRELHNSDPERRFAAARALGCFGDAAIPALRSALGDPIPGLREMITNALRDISHPVPANAPDP